MKNKYLIKSVDDLDGIVLPDSIHQEGIKPGKVGGLTKSVIHTPFIPFASLEEVYNLTRYLGYDLFQNLGVSIEIRYTGSCCPRYFGIGPEDYSEMREYCKVYFGCSSDEKIDSANIALMMFSKLDENLLVNFMEKLKKGEI